MKATETLHDRGQSLWLDNITRELLETGTLARYIGELSVTPNRGDCLSVLGVAREVAALTGATLHEASVTLVEEKTPGAAVQSDDEILDVFRTRGQSGYHAMGTCRMGADVGAVLDGRLRVRGASALRVVDLSVVPGPISGNTNGPTMVIAARAADLILEDAR